MSASVSVLLLLAVGAVLYEASRRWARPPVASKAAGSAHRAAAAPVAVTPLTEFDLSTADPIAYRPFRYGPKYHQTMGIRSLDMSKDSWIEVDKELGHFLAQKRDRLAGPRGHKGVQVMPDAEFAAHELLDTLVSYLLQRYPTVYSRDKSSGGIRIAGVEDTVPVGQEPPMSSVCKLIQDDVAIMLEGEDGHYYLRGGCILLAGFWRLEDKLGMRLDEIHKSGNVPHYREKLEVSMDRYFSRLQEDKPVQRNNYFLQCDDQLPWSSTIGPEDDANFQGHPGWHMVTQEPHIEHMHFRSERQTLRRLPRSRAIIFTVRTYFIPVTNICREPHVPGRLASSIRSWSPEIAEYKGLDRYKDVLIPYLDKCHREQIDAGITSIEPAPFVYPF